MNTETKTPEEDLRLALIKYLKYKGECQSPNCSTSDVWDTIEKIVQNRAQGLENLHFTYEANQLLFALKHIERCFTPFEWQTDHSKEVNELLPNLKASTENLCKIKDKDQWMDEVRGNDNNKKWAVVLYDELKHIYDMYSDSWTNFQDKETADILYEYQTSFEDAPDDKIDKAIEFCNKKIKESFCPNSPIATSIAEAPYLFMNQFLSSLK